MGPARIPRRHARGRPKRLSRRVTAAAEAARRRAARVAPHARGGRRGAAARGAAWLSECPAVGAAAIVYERYSGAGGGGVCVCVQGWDEEGGGGGVGSRLRV